MSGLASHEFWKTALEKVLVCRKQHLQEKISQITLYTMCFF